MKYKCCHWINQGLNFTRWSLRFCWYEYLQCKGENFIFEKYDGKNIDYDKYFEVKNKYRDMCKSGNFHENCAGCIYLYDREWSDDDFVDHFMFNHWLNCNSNCIYCDQTRLPAEEKIQYYDLSPVIRDMKRHNLLRATGDDCIIFGGGEPLLLKEFDELIKIFTEEGYRNIRVNSSGIKYSNVLAESIKSGASSLCISPDAGTWDTHIRVKRIDSYHIVWRNIEKYVRETDAPSKINVKFILIPGLNDTYEEIDAFINQLLKYNVKKAVLSLESHWYQDNYKKFPPEIYKKADYFIGKCAENGIDYEPTCEVENLIKYRGEN